MKRFALVLALGMTANGCLPTMSLLQASSSHAAASDGDEPPQRSAPNAATPRTLPAPASTPKSNIGDQVLGTIIGGVLLAGVLVVAIGVTAVH